MNRRKLPGLYIHVPFCRSKCRYCDFYSITSLDLVPEWLEALEREAVLRKNLFPVFGSLYLGGGTPTALMEHEAGLLMDCIRRHFRFAEGAEMSVEANPDDVCREKLRFLLGQGFNRISLGVQSFDDGELRRLGRRHAGRKAEAALGLVMSSGFDNVSVDLMYGLEGQRLTGWARSLRRAVEFEPHHLSCYQLTIEPGTPIGRLAEEGRIVPIDEDSEHSFFLFMSRFLTQKRYIHYEVSNFARKPQFECVHNKKYWNRAPYLGLGPGAHSFKDAVRWSNVKSVSEYCGKLSVGEPPVCSREDLSSEQVRLEKLFLGFRTRAGVDLSALGSMPDPTPILKQLEKTGIVRVHRGKVVSTLKGLLVADSLPLLF
jgi:oxygen-independent coproporphyrinogen-3 oxidase